MPASVKNFTAVLLFVFALVSGPAFGLEKMGSQHYWVMPASVGGCQVDVAINGAALGRLSETAGLDASDHVEEGAVNTVRLEVSSCGGSDTGCTTLVFSPELSRESLPDGNGYTIMGKSNLLRFEMPHVDLKPDTVIEAEFLLKNDPNPELTQRYCLVSDGVFTGHKVVVKINGTKVADVLSPNSFFDLNPYLVSGRNEFTFEPVLLDGFEVTAPRRQAMAGEKLRLCVGPAGDYNPETYSQGIRKLETVSAFFEQPADSDVTVSPGSFVLIAK